jgi:hypothetical protein
MGGIRILAGTDYTGEGISRGLARGLPVYYGDCNLTGEGMGIGGIALRNRESTYFSRGWTDSHEDGVFRRTFSLDTRMRWAFLGFPSAPLTRFAESGARAYMRSPRLQPFLLWALYPMRTLLGVRPFLEPVAPRGKVTFTYRIAHGHVDVVVAPEIPAAEGETLCLLNELSAAWFTAGWEEGRAGRPPPGWERVRSDDLPVSLVDPVHGVRFFMEMPAATPRSVPLAVYRGRERNGDRCWAGFCIEFGPLDGSGRVPEVQYRIGIAEGVSM